jgi:hypothetical protein
MGRRCDWFIERCGEIIEEEKLVEFIGRVAAGKELEEQIVRNGTGFDRIKTQCSTKDRLRAFEMLADWGVGKPTPIVPGQVVGTQTVIDAFQVMTMLRKLESGELSSAKLESANR